MPPMPMIGTPGRARATWKTMRTARGLIAGPESPPVPKERIGRPLSASIAMPTKVLTSDRTSAPDSRAARAEATMSGALGESLTIRGRRVAARTRETSEAVADGELPKSIPPFSTLGHEMLSSMAASPSASSSARTTAT